MKRKSEPKPVQDKLKIMAVIKAEYIVSELSEIADIQENIDRAMDELRSLGSAEGNITFSVVGKVQ